MGEFKAAVREFIAGKFLSLAMAIDAEFVFSIMSAILASENDKARHPG